MRTLTEHFSEMPTSDVHYVRISIRIEHPDLPTSRTYAILQDARLMDLTALPKPPENADQWTYHEWMQRRELRSQLVNALGAQIARAMYVEFENMDKQP